MLRVCAFITALFQVAPCFLIPDVLLGQNTLMGCNNQTLTGDALRQCALTDGVKMLLEKRNEEWGWGERSEAEAIIALHLSDDSWFAKNDSESYISVKQMNLDLLSAISNDVTLSNAAWGRGKLAHYVLGLTATCQDPRNFYGHNLIDKLQNHLVVSSQQFKDNRFAYALVVLALCNANASVDTSYMNDLSLSPGNYTFGIDEAALIYLAFKCVNSPTYFELAEAALNYIISKQGKGDLFGNEYSTALAIQAIFASNDKSLFPKTIAGMSYLINSINRSKNPETFLLLSVLPAIAKKSYIDVGTMPCLTKEIVITTITTTVFTIKISVINKVTSNYVHVWSAPMHPGESLYNALQNLQAEDATFTFTSISHTFGKSLQSVCGMVAIESERQYWQLLDSNDQPLSKASDHTFPTEGSSYTLRLTRW